MTVPGQSQITYGYNNAGQVTSLTQGSTVVSLDDFADGKLQTLTLKPLAHAGHPELHLRRRRGTLPDLLDARGLDR